MKINIHTHHATESCLGVEIVNQYPLRLDPTLPIYSVGIHPWYINETTLAEEFFLLEQQLQSNSCIALGECGLDKKVTIPIKLQIDVFKRQLLLAEKYKKAVILHVVSAYQEVIEIQKELKLTVPLIIHGFNKKAQVAESLCKHGFYLSFGKQLLYNEQLKDIFRSMPKTQVFLETDDAKEVLIEELYEAACRLDDTIEEQIEKNYKSVFNR